MAEQGEEDAEREGGRRYLDPYLFRPIGTALSRGDAEREGGRNNLEGGRQYISASNALWASLRLPTTSAARTESSGFQGEETLALLPQHLSQLPV